MTYHEQLAVLWCKWHAQRGTAKQIAPIVQRTPVHLLERMLTERGIQLPSVKA